MWQGLGDGHTKPHHITSCPVSSHLVWCCRTGLICQQTITWCRNLSHCAVSMDVIQMTHYGKCDMLKYICPEVEMSTWGLARVLIFQVRDIYICMSHESIMRHLYKVHRHSAARHQVMVCWHIKPVLHRASFVLSHHWLKFD